MRSSYLENNYGDLIREYVLAWQPANFVELGVLDGYSTLAIAKGIKEINRLRGWNMPKLDAYDLFDDYQYKHGNKAEVEKLMVDNEVSDYVNIIKGNAYEAYKNYPDMVLDTTRGIEFLHIDISNTGTVIRDIMELWHPKIGQRGIVLIEGGSEERDNVDWMKTYNMPSIKKEIETNSLINKYYMYGACFRFPALTVLLRKWWSVDAKL